MKKKNGFCLKEVCGAKFLIAEGDENIDFSSLIALNESSTYLWDSIKDDEEFTAESLAEKLTEEYDVDFETALKDTTVLINEMTKAGVIE